MDLKGIDHPNMMTHVVRNLYDFHNTKGDVLKKVGVKTNTDNIGPH